MLARFLPLKLPFLIILSLISTAQAHHGPPHDEIDEFDENVSTQFRRESTRFFSWPIAAVSVAGVALAFRISRKVEQERLATQLS